ncbi:MAG TPA: alpha/beta fold hydrolase [Rhizomicrobium sp.]|jgi:hypothetical protein
MRAAILLSLGLVFATMSAAAAEQDITLETKTGALHGSLIKATIKAGGPAVLILPGSGPTDRDGNNPSFRPDTLKLFAQGLAAKNISTLRIDKRGIGASQAAMTAESDLRFQTYSDDAKAWAAKLKSETGARCVWLAGHSEGALVAEVAAQNNPDICGLILIAGAGRKAGAILREQLGASPALDAAQKDSAFHTLASLEAGQFVLAPGLPALFRPSVQPYMISWLKLDPAAILAGLKVPVLILQGENDIQVSVSDAKLLAAARPDAKLIILPGVNHVLKVAPGDRAGNIATYNDMSLPLAPGISDTVADFVLNAHL